jgi:hypothetical protein
LIELPKSLKPLEGCATYNWKFLRHGSPSAWADDVTGP